MEPTNPQFSNSTLRALTGKCFRSRWVPEEPWLEPPWLRLSKYFNGVEHLGAINVSKYFFISNLNTCLSQWRTWNTKDLWDLPLLRSSFGYQRPKSRWYSHHYQVHKTHSRRWTISRELQWGRGRGSWSPHRYRGAGWSLRPSRHRLPLGPGRSWWCPTSPGKHPQSQEESPTPSCSWSEEHTLLGPLPAHVDFTVRNLHQLLGLLAWLRRQAWTLFPWHSLGPCWQTKSQPSPDSVNCPGGLR